jgi:hypothetical protein
MDNERFDELIRTVTSGTTRRGALKVFAASLVGAAGLASGLEAEAKKKRKRRKRAVTKSTKINYGVCEGLSSGKVDFPEGTGPTETVCAADYGGGDLCIIGYCAKAGSIKQGQGLGPEYDFGSVLNQLPAKCVTLSHSSLKDLSHFSLEFGDCEGPEPTTCPGLGTEKVICCDKPGTNSGNPSICCPKVASPCGTTSSGQACCGAGSGRACNTNAGFQPQDGICPTE